MRIAFIYDVPYPWHIGGIEFTNYTEAAELAKHHNVDFFTLRWPEMKKEFKYNGINYHTFHSVTQQDVYRHGRRSIGEAIAFSIGLFRIFSHDYDVLVVNQFPVLHLPVVKLYCMIKRCKLIMEVAEVWDRAYWNEYIGTLLGGFAMTLSTMMLKNADMYLVNSSDTAAKLHRLGVSKDLIIRFTPAIDDSLINMALKGKKSGSKTVVFSGRFIKEKRISRWIELVAMASKEDKAIRGIIIGSGPESEALQKQIDTEKLNDVIQLLPFHKEKIGFYKQLRNCSLLLHMSEREGLGIVAMESVALGTPVLLPSDTPMPNEVKEMCIVENEEGIPRKIVEILNAKDKGIYISNEKNLWAFFTSNTLGVFTTIFKRLGLKS